MNDDLGNFPTPKSPTPPEPKPQTPQPSTTYTPPAFEPTPDEIPSFATAQPNEPISNSISSTDSDLPAGRQVNQTPTNLNTENTAPIDDFFPEVKSPEPEPPAPPVIPSTIPTGPTLATTPPQTKSPNSSLISIALVLVAGIGISGSVFLYSQSSALKKQLTDITTTLEQQKTIITPSPTPTIIDIPSPTPTLEATDEAIITPSPTASPSMILSNDLIPLALAPQALKVGINHEPNAQLILIKAENATDPANSLIKYFFRKDLTTKKYFYVAINGKNESEINDNAIYVNPDNNIPSLNDLVLGNKLGIDFPEAYKIATDLCTSDQSLIEKCKALQASAQFIKSGANTIWQITLSTGNEKLIYQIDSKTKAVLFKPTK